MRTKFSTTSAVVQVLRAPMLVMFAILLTSPLSDILEAQNRKRPVSRATTAEQSRAWYVVEKIDTELGPMFPGETEIANDAIVIRVFSDSDWVLRVRPDQMTIASGARVSYLPFDRLSIRSNNSSWQPVDGAFPAIVGEGTATAGAGAVIVLDLRLSLEQTDPVGWFGTRFEILLEPA